jgi:hypothetical protein
VRRGADRKPAHKDVQFEMRLATAKCAQGWPVLPYQARHFLSLNPPMVSQDLRQQQNSFERMEGMENVTQIL